MVNSIIKLMENSKFKNVTLLHWSNSKLNFEYRKRWGKKDTSHLVGDILQENGELLLMEEMNERNLKINFLDYIKIKHYD